MSAEQATGLGGLKRWRLILLRIAYLPLAVGLALVQLPLLANLGPNSEIMGSTVICMLSALCLLSFVGLLKPIEMLPLLAFEVLWKVLWLGLVGIPAWRSGPLTPDMAESVFACALIVIIVPLVPWDFAFRRLLHPRHKTVQAD